MGGIGSSALIVMRSKSICLSDAGLASQLGCRSKADSLIICLCILDYQFIPNIRGKNGVLFVGPLQLLNSLGCSEKWAGCRFKFHVVKKYS